MCSWSLQFWKKGCLLCLHFLFPAVPTAASDLCGSCFYPTGTLLPCIKLCGAVCSPEETESEITSGDQACAQDTHCFLCQCLFSIQPYHPWAGHPGTASDGLLKKHLLVMLDFMEFQNGWGLLRTDRTLRENLLCSGQGHLEQVSPGVLSKVEDRKTRREMSEKGRVQALHRM